MSYRERSWEDAIHECRDKPLRTIMCEYQPGNGTRYGVVITHVPEGEGTAYMRGPCWIVSIPDMGRAMVVQDNGCMLHFSYVMEKMSPTIREFGQGDAVPIAELIGHLTDRPACSSREVEEREREARAARAESRA